MSIDPASPNVCLFCEIPSDRIVSENEYAYTIRDGFPITAGHTLIISKRHVPDYFDLTADELAACNELMSRTRHAIILDDDSVDAFNIGVNAGAAAGQTIFHCHIHLIPRRAGDVENPRGGVRHLIPGKGNY